MALLAAGAPALAQPVEVASGADLAAWQALEQRRLSGDDAAEAYRDFLLSYTESPLAVMAWTRLVSLDATDGSWVQTAPVRAIVQQVRRRWEAHQHTLNEADRTKLTVVDVEP